MNSMNSSSDFISKWQEEEITFTSDEIDLDVFATVQSSSSLNSSNFTSDELEEDFFESFAWSSEFMLRYSPAVSIVYFIAYTVVFVIGVIGESIYLMKKKERKNLHSIVSITLVYTSSKQFIDIILLSLLIIIIQVTAVW